MENNFLNLSYPQKAILSMEQFYPNTSMNTITGKISIHDKVNFKLLKKAILLFVENTNNIRFMLNNNQNIVTQYETDFKPFNIEHIKLTNENEEEISDKIARKVFDLYNSPLYYFATFENPDLTGGFFVCVHHIIADAWAMSILISSIISIYSKLLQKEEIDFTNNYDYRDFVANENDYLQSSKFKQDELFWDELFKENIFENSYSKPISSSSSPCLASRAQFPLSKKVTKKITNFCNQIKVSPFTFILFAMGIYESKIKQTNSVVLSAPILNRSSKKDKQTFGLYVNNMLYKLDIDDNTCFYDAITSLNKSQFSYLRHQKYPMQNLITNLKNKFNTKENIYDTSVSYQNARTNHCLDNVSYDSRWLFSGFSAVSLLFHIYDMDDTDSLSFIYDYQESSYQYSQIKDIHNRLLYIIEQLIENQNILIKDIELVTNDEKNKLLKDFNQTYVEYDKSKTILDLWEKQVVKKASKTAIVCGKSQISYQELDKLSNQFSNILQQKYKIKSGANIAIMLDRSIDLIIAILAVLKCGCTYVLIDTHHPIDRKEYMTKNSNSQLVISNVDIPKETLPKYKKPETSSNDALYLLYTSGSTGAPKAVTVTHKNFHNYLLGISRVVDYSGEKNVLSMASISFDVFGYELWVTLLNGLTLVLATEEEQNDFMKLNDLITKHKINILYGTPSKIQSLMSSANATHDFSSLLEIGIGGEAFSNSFLKELRQITSANFYNMYGPTEATVGCCCKKIENLSSMLTIGKPLANVRFYVLDKNLKLCPPGIRGELYIAGDGVVQGYYNNYELTRKSFLPDIFKPNSTMYRSGDMVSWTNMGELMFYGRSDSQVKIRGYRIELSEIERVLSSHQFIRSSMVINYHENDRDFLCAYYTTDFTIQNYELKLFLANKLPNYMIPSYFIPLSTFPLTVNGKIDKKQLPSPLSLKDSGKYVRPENDLQKNICAALENCLFIKKLSIEEDFNNLGIDSLTIIKVQSYLSNLGIMIPTQYFYDYSNIKDLSFALEHSGKAQDTSLVNANYPFLQHDLSKLKPKKHNVKNILLTGCTGFLGIHILEALLKENCKIYCLVRSSNLESAKKRILSMFNFYFKNVYTTNFLFDKIEILVGDIKYKNLGLTEELLEVLGNKINHVIHSAALVKHLGRYDEFKKMNLEGTKNVASFCKKYNIGLSHISTTSVSGDFMPLKVTEDDVNFTEENFFIGQNYSENYYIKSKLLTEEYIFQSIKEKEIKANIFRVGNLTGRNKDGLFQYNIDSNAFYNKLQFILKNKFFYESGTMQEFDLSPVDEIANAIVQLIFNYGSTNKIFHMMHPKKFNMKTLIEDLNKLGFKIKILSDDSFYKKFMKMDLNANSLIINDYNLYTNVSYLNIKTNCDITLKYLKEISFKYPKIDIKYLEKIINYMKDIKFI